MSGVKKAAGSLDLVGAAVAIVLGILLLVDLLDVETMLGIALLVVGLIALAKNI